MSVEIAKYKCDVKLDNYVIGEAVAMIKISSDEGVN